MRLLHILSSADPNYGGTTEAVRLLLEHGAESDQAELVTLDAPGSDFLAHWTDIPVHALGPSRSGFAYAPRLIPWLQTNRGRFDGVVLHGMWQYCGYAVLRTLAGRVPYVVFPHGMLDPYFKRAFPRKHLKKLAYWLAVEYWVLRRAHRVLFTCQAEADLARQSFALHRWNPGIMSIGTIPPTGDPTLQRQAFLHLCPSLEGRRYLLFLGRIHPKKGCDLLVHAFAQAAHLDPGLDLVLAGPDPAQWRRALESIAQAAGIAHRIHWPGMVAGDAKWGAFLAAEAFILPSHQENFGIAVAEALACGIPVLLSDKVNIAADIAADGAGLVEPDDATGTLRLLERWLALPASARLTMQASALNCFHRRYDMRENAKKLTRLFEQAPTADHASTHP